MNLIKQRIKWVMAALPQESTSTNIMRQVLKVVREEYETDTKVNLQFYFSFFANLLTVLF